MRVLDIYAGAPLALDMAWACQRAAAEKLGAEWISLDVSGKNRSSIVLPPCDAVLLRDIDLLGIDLPTKPVFLDLALPTELGTTCPWRGKLKSVRRAFCYSSAVDDGLRKAGLGRIRVLAGPYVDRVEAPFPEKTTIAVLDTASYAPQVLREVVQYKALKALVDLDVVSAMPARGAIRADDDLDAAMRGTLVLSPTDVGDMGQSHPGAILALATCRALATTYTQSLSAMAFPQGAYINIRNYSPRSYVAAVALFLANPRRYLEWPAKVSTDAGELPALLLEELEKPCPSSR